VGKEGHAWLSSRKNNKEKDGFQISLKELLSISGGSLEEKNVSTTYLDNFKSNQVEKLKDFIDYFNIDASQIPKDNIKKVAEDLGIDIIGQI